MPAVRALADGNMHIAQKAVALGFADKVGDAAAAERGLRAQIRRDAAPAARARDLVIASVR